MNYASNIYLTSIALNAAGLAASAGEYSNVANGMWQGANSKWYSLKWGGNRWTGARSLAKGRAGAFSLVGKGFFYASAGVSVIQGGSNISSGNYSGAAKNGVDIFFGAIGTFGGPKGMAIGAIYFGGDFLAPYVKNGVNNLSYQYNKANAGLTDMLIRRQFGGR